ncbi:MAG: MFS transporter [Chloroflexi bacterium]|nr:MFS transporter [Chloroflexota bacterium]
MSPANQTAEGERQESRWAMMLASLRYPDFRLIWIGSLTEHFGEMMEMVTILWLANEMSHSPLMLSLVGSGRFLPMLVFPIIGGVVADRVNRRHLLMAALAGATLLYITLALLVATNSVAMWHLIVVSLLTGVATSFNHPARATIVPNLVRREHLLNAISLDTFSVMAMRVVSMPLAGYLIVALGVWPIFIIAAVCAVIPIILLRFVKTPLNPPPIKEQTVRQNLINGFHYLRSHSIVLVLLLLYILPQLVLNTVVNLLPVVAESILKVGAVGYGYLQGASGLGALTCLIGLAMLTYYQGKRKLMLGAGIILGVGLLGFSASQWFFLSLPLLVVIGGTSATFTAIITALVQGFIPDEMRGRIMSWREIAWGLSPVGNIAFGAIAQNSSVPLSLALLGGLTLLVAFSLIVFLSRFRSLEQTIAT